VANETHYDPRTDIETDIEVGNVYEDQRSGERYELVFEYPHAVLLAEHDTGSPGHMLESRAEFEKNVGADRYQLETDTDSIVDTDTETVRDDDNEPVTFTEVAGIGEGTAGNLRANDIVTRGDVRRASRSQLEAVRGMGQTNTDRLLDHVDE